MDLGTEFVGIPDDANGSAVYLILLGYLKEFQV